MFNEASTREITFGKNYLIIPREPELQPSEPDTLFTLDISGAEYQASLSQNNILTPEEFSESIDSDIRSSNESSALVYVHRFNESYEESVIRAAHISYDLSFPGSTFVFSWPARQSSTTYLADSQRAKDSERYFESFMNQILSTTNIRRIYIIAHHLGGRIVSTSLQHMFSIQPNYRDRIREIILIAPDIDTDQFSDFITSGFNPVVNYLAKSHYRWGQNADIVLRMPCGAGVGAGPFHSQTNEAWFTKTPGLIIVYPAFPDDAKGLLISSVENPNPVLFFEHKGLYRSIRGNVPEGYYNTPIGKSKLLNVGSDITIITLSLIHI